MSQSSTWRICPNCRAYNTVHVLRCYKCEFDLPSPRVLKSSEAFESKEYRIPVSDSRHAERRPLGVPGAILEVNGEIRHDILIENISVGGLLFHSDLYYQEHDRFLVLVPLDTENYVVEAIARRSETQGFSQFRYLVGVEFVDPKPEFVRRVSCLCLAGLYSFV